MSETLGEPVLSHYEEDTVFVRVLDSIVTLEGNVQAGGMAGATRTWSAAGAQSAGCR
jgi:hypothetical protein